MNGIQVIVHRQARVLTTGQLAESYGTDSKQISYNFNYNKDRYMEGKHFIALEGEEKREFINRHEIQDGSKNAKTLYLWTEKGAWLHAKSLNTDAAWDAYEMLVDEYYKIVEQAQPQTNSLELALQAALKHEQEIKGIKSDVDYLKGSMRVDSLQHTPSVMPDKHSVREKLKERTYGLMDAQDIVHGFMEDDVDLSGGE